MAKKQKKRRKIARRQAAAASTPKAAPVTPHPASDDPALPDPPAADTRQEVKATFKVDDRRGPDGIDASVAALEYPAVRRDLRKLGLTILAFIVILVGLVILDNNTDTLDVLGDKLFKLWE